MKANSKEIRVKGLKLLFTGVALAGVSYFLGINQSDDSGRSLKIAGDLLFLLSAVLMFLGFHRSILEKRGTGHILICALSLMAWVKLLISYGDLRLN